MIILDDRCIRMHRYISSILSRTIHNHGILTSYCIAGGIHCLVVSYSKLSLLVALCFTIVFVVEYQGPCFAI